MNVATLIVQLQTMAQPNDEVFLIVELAPEPRQASARFMELPDCGFPKRTNE